MNSINVSIKPSKGRIKRIVIKVGELFSELKRLINRKIEKEKDIKTHSDFITNTLLYCFSLEYLLIIRIRRLIDINPT